MNGSLCYYCWRFLFQQNSLNCDSCIYGFFFISNPLLFCFFLQPCKPAGFAAVPVKPVRQFFRRLRFQFFFIRPDICLAILDDIQFEFRRDPGCKFKSDINMRIDSAAIPSGFCKEPDCTEFLCPGLDRKNKSIRTGILSLNVSNSIRLNSGLDL